MNKATHKLVTNHGFEFEVYSIGNRTWSTPGGAVHIGEEAIRFIYPLPSEPEEPETFDYKEAMRKFADGVELEVYYATSWCPLKDGVWHSVISFDMNRLYRVKPAAPPEPKVTTYYANYRDAAIGYLWSSISSCEDADRHCVNKAQCRLKITVTEGGKLPRVEVLEAN